MLARRRLAQAGGPLGNGIPSGTAANYVERKHLTAALDELNSASRRLGPEESRIIIEHQAMAAELLEEVEAVRVARANLRAMELTHRLLGGTPPSGATTTFAIVPDDLETVSSNLTPRGLAITRPLRTNLIPSVNSLQSGLPPQVQPVGLVGETGAALPPNIGTPLERRFLASNTDFSVLLPPDPIPPHLQPANPQGLPRSDVRLVLSRAQQRDLLRQARLRLASLEASISVSHSLAPQFYRTDGGRAIVSVGLSEFERQLAISEGEVRAIAEARRQALVAGRPIAEARRAAAARLRRMQAGTGSINLAEIFGPNASPAGSGRRGPGAFELSMREAFPMERMYSALGPNRLETIAMLENTRVNHLRRMAASGLLPSGATIDEIESLVREARNSGPGPRRAPATQLATEPLTAEGLAAQARALRPPTQPSGPTGLYGGYESLEAYQTAVRLRRLAAVASAPGRVVRGTIAAVGSLRGPATFTMREMTTFFRPSIPNPATAGGRLAGVGLALGIVQLAADPQSLFAIPIEAVTGPPTTIGDIEDDRRFFRQQQQIQLRQLQQRQFEFQQETNRLRRQAVAEHMAATGLPPPPTITDIPPRFTQDEPTRYIGLPGAPEGYLPSVGDQYRQNRRVFARERTLEEFMANAFERAQQFNFR